MRRHYHQPPLPAGNLAHTVGLAPACLRGGINQHPRWLQQHNNSVVPCGTPAWLQLFELLPAMSADTSTRTINTCIQDYRHWRACFALHAKINFAVESVQSARCAQKRGVRLHVLTALMSPLSSTFLTLLPRRLVQAVRSSHGCSIWASCNRTRTLKLRSTKERTSRQV